MIDAEKIIAAMQPRDEGSGAYARDKSVIRLLCAEIARLEQRIEEVADPGRALRGPLPMGGLAPPTDRLVSLKRVREIVRLSAFNFVYVNEALDAEFGKEQQ